MYKKWKRELPGFAEHNGLSFKAYLLKSDLRDLWNLRKAN